MFSWPKARPLVCAHRCHWDGGEANTLASFRTAVAAGVEMVEFDVRRSADGVLYGWHDRRLPDRSNPRKLSYEQILTRASEQPLIEELLREAATHPTVRLNIDLKESGLEEQLLAVALAHLPAERFIITSRDGDQLARIKDLAPEVTVGLSIGDPLLSLDGLLALAKARRHRPDLLAIHQRHLLFGLHRRAARVGLPCLVWTVDDERTLTRPGFLENVAGVVTNRPELAQRLLTSIGLGAATSTPIRIP